VIAERRIKWGVLFNGDNLSLDQILRYARMAEEAGADSLWSSDLGRDAFTPLAAMAGVWCADDAYVRAGQSVPLS